MSVGDRDAHSIANTPVYCAASPVSGPSGRLTACDLGVRSIASLCRQNQYGWYSDTSSDVCEWDLVGINAFKS